MWIVLFSAARAAPELSLYCVMATADEVHVIVQNLGDTDSRGFYIDIFLDLPAPPTYGMWGHWVWVPGVRAGDAESAFLTIPGIAQWPGGWVDVIVDSDQRVAENSDDDNIYSMFEDEGSVHVHP
jgi:hypothetical protein